MPAPRGLTPEERAAWARLANTVTPLDPAKMAEPAPPPAQTSSPPRGGGAGSGWARPSAPDTPTRSPPKGDGGNGLDASWERKLRAATIDPDFTLDLHGLTLDGAHARLDSGLTQAKAMDARLVLLVTGRARPVDTADRGSKRGAIRAKVLDWLAAGPHGSDIAAIRHAHRRHGGEGALYIVLRRRR
jgi:DNA-nicking Smr family endonuclease